MDASTTIPIEKAKPAKDITFIESPNPAIATKVPITETGMAINIIPVGINDLKNKIRMLIAKHPPIQIFCFTKLMADEIYVVSSKITLRSKPLSFKLFSFKASICSLNLDIVATTFVPCSLKTLNITAFSPLSLLKLVRF